MNKLFGYYFWKSNGDGTESSDFCEGEIPSWKKGVRDVVPLYQIYDSEQEVNEDLTTYLARPVCMCMDQASMDYCLNKDRCRAIPKAFKSSEIRNDSNRNH